MHQLAPVERDGRQPRGPPIVGDGRQRARPSSVTGVTPIERDGTLARRPGTAQAMPRLGHRRTVVPQHDGHHVCRQPRTRQPLCGGDAGFGLRSGCHWTVGTRSGSTKTKCSTPNGWRKSRIHRTAASPRIASGRSGTGHRKLPHSAVADEEARAWAPASGALPTRTSRARATRPAIASVDESARRIDSPGAIEDMRRLRQPAAAVEVLPDPAVRGEGPHGPVQEAAYLGGSSASARQFRLGLRAGTAVDGLRTSLGPVSSLGSASRRRSDGAG